MAKRSKASIFSAPALRVEQPLGSYWVAAIPATTLLEVTIPDRLRLVMDPRFATERPDEWREALRVIGTQRELEGRRLNEIGAYIDTRDSTFPNAIILAANSAQEGEEGHDRPKWDIETSGEGHILTIPENPMPAKVVDGQHRLYGFLRSQVDRTRFGLLCAIFFELPAPLQAMLFATINTNQKPVRRGLALNLYGYNIEDEDRSVWFPEKLAVFITRRLNWDDGSALCNRIRLEAEGAGPPELLPGASRSIPLAAIVDGVLSLIAKNPKADRTALRSERLFRTPRRSQLPDDGTPLRGWYLNCADRELYEIVKAFVGVVDDVIWQRGKERSMLTRAVGVRALFQMLGRLLSDDRPGPGHDKRVRKDEIQAVASRVRESLNAVAPVDFADPFFEATGRGQRRILNALLAANGLVDLSVEVGREDLEEYRRLIPSPARRRRGGP